MSIQKLALTVGLIFISTGIVFANPHVSDPIAPILLGVTTILFVAVIGRFAARKAGQLTVLGELIMGVI